MRIARTSASALTLTLALAAFACGGGTPPPAATMPAGRTLATPTPPPIDRSPVPEPEGLVVVGRIANPDAILKTAGGWVQLPLPGGNDLVRSLTDDAVGDSVDLSQPIDGAVTLGGGRGNPKPLYAFSVAVKSFDDAKTKLSARHKTSPAANGGLNIEGIGRSGAIGGDDAEDDDDDSGCVLAHASSGARLVCGEPGALEALTPYLTRTLPRRTFTSDVHLEMRFAPVRGPVSDLRAQLPILARGLLGSQSQAVRDLVDAAIGEVADVIGDTSRIVIDGRIADAGIDATMRAEYGSAKSVIAQLATSSVDRAGPPPASFWHLPQETDLAFFGKGADPKIFDHPRELLTNLLVETFTEGGMPEAERKTIEDLVAKRMLPLFTGPGVYAKGYDQPALERAMTARKAVRAGELAAADEAERAVGVQMIGWHLYQVSEPVANVGPILKDWSSLWARPGFKAWATKQVAAKRMARVRVAPLPSAVVLPKDTVHLEITIPREDLEVPGATGKTKKVARKPIVVHVFAVPDAGTTWLAFGLDGTLVAKNAAASLSSAPQTGTLGAAPGLQELRDASKINGAAVVSLRAFLVFTALDKTRSPFEMLGMLPHKGAAPILMTFTAEGPSQSPDAQDAKAGATASTIRIPRGVIEDAVRLAMTGR